MSREPRIDAYIAAQADFARPILEHIRATVHAACPAVEEGIKWGMPAFGYHGRPLANMAAFKAHATMGFWQGEQVRDGVDRSGAMGDFGRIASLADLPDAAALSDLVRKAAALIDAGVKPVRARTVKPPVETPDDLAAAIALNPAAQTAFDAFPAGCRRDYVEWVTGARREETRARRIAQAVEWMAQGKKRNWKYESC